MKYKYLFVLVTGDEIVIESTEKDLTKLVKNENNNVYNWIFFEIGKILINMKNVVYISKIDYDKYSD